jgi:hypothetical protein
MKSWFHPGMKKAQYSFGWQLNAILPEPPHRCRVKIHWQQSVAKIIGIRQQEVESLLESQSQLGYWLERNEPSVSIAASHSNDNERTPA